MRIFTVNNYIPFIISIFNIILNFISEYCINIATNNKYTDLSGNAFSGEECTTLDLTRSCLRKYSFNLPCSHSPRHSCTSYKQRKRGKGVGKYFPSYVTARRALFSETVKRAKVRFSIACPDGRALIQRGGIGGTFL